MATSSSSPWSSLPVGFRFHPKEEELVNHYLKKKIHGKDFNDVIPEIDICSYEPWDLPGFSSIRSDDEEWFYFSRPDYKFRNNESQAKRAKQRNRATQTGFWKITGGEKEIKAPDQSKTVIGKKRILTFYTGKVRSERRTGWVIHEYYIPETLLPDAARQRDFEICLLKKKDESTDVGTCDEAVPNNASDFQNDAQNILENLQITLPVPDYTRPEEVMARLFPSPESPQSDDYFASELRYHSLHANAGSDDRLELQPFGHDDSEDEDLFVCSILNEDAYSLEERSRTAFLNHSSEPKSLHKVYDEGIHQQKNATSVNVSANLPLSIGRVQSVHLEESKSKARYELQADFSSVTDRSSLNESGGKKGEMVATGSGPALPLRPDDYIPQRRLETGTAQSAQSYRGHTKQSFQPQAPKLRSKLPEKPMAPPAPSNDEGKGMKQKRTGTAITDWKSSFIVWKDSPLSLGSYPRIVYIRNMILGLFMFKIFLGELFSYGTWYTS